MNKTNLRDQAFKLASVMYDVTAPEEIIKQEADRLYQELKAQEYELGFVMVGTGRHFKDGNEANEAMEEKHYEI